MAILNTVRGLHVSPGIYTKETELKTSNNTFGITTLGLAGETLKGPAFSPISVSNWREYSDTFGGTSTEIYKGSRYPRYELPYVAQDYLTESNQLIVTRVLGLSGYNAGRAWLIKAIGSGIGKDMLVAVIRSRGHYVKTFGNPSFSSAPVASIEANVQYVVGRANQSSVTPLTPTDYITYNSKQYTFGQRFFGVAGQTIFTKNPAVNPQLTVYGYCGTNYDYDKFMWDVYDVTIGPTSIPLANFTCGKVGTWVDGAQVAGIPSTPSDFGTFQLTVTLRNNDGTAGDTVSFTVSFNPGQKNYIYNVIGGTPDDNDAPIYIEELYDVAFQQLVFKNGVDPVNFIEGISTTLESTLNESSIIPMFQPVVSILTTPNQSVTKSMLGNRYLYTGFDVNGNSLITEYAKETITIITTPTYSKTSTKAFNTLGTTDIGKILVVKEDVDSSGKVTYNYHYIVTTTDGTIFEEKLDSASAKNPDTDGYYWGFVFVANEQLFYEIKTNGGTTVVERVIGDLNDYTESFRYASSPWIVSQMIGTFANNQVHKLFRFHSISDGDTANTLFKISIQNIDPDNLTFDVIIRDFNDSDASVTVLESYLRCNLNPDSSSYILNRIGSFDNSTPIVSKYVMVEMAENDNIRFSIPCGFLGYPVRDLVDENVTKPALAYNVTLNEEIKTKRQYFGMSDLVGIDTDIISYKGRSAYSDGTFTDGFHLDSRVSSCFTLVDGENPGVDCTTNPTTPVLGMFTWQTVSVDTVGAGGEAPQITGDDITGTIYEDVTTRKFTFCMYGGFDGWDIYRTSRTTSDDFKMNRYKGKINPNTGHGEHFSWITNNELLNLPEKGITSDFYAFWAAMLTFNNPAETPINVFATPGIDYVNDTLLVSEGIEMIEDPAHQKAIYIATTPDKPFGATDAVASMYSPQDVVDNLEGTELDSSYVATYYPWCRYMDSNENKTIFLPPTRDVVRLLALIDNTSYAWFPPAGDQRGRVNAINARINTKIGDEDILYTGRINPIKTYARDGIYIWGQKNLKVSYDNDKEALTRIGVRRMMLRIRDLIIRVNRQLIFTPNDATVKNKFISNCTAVLNDVRSNRGISDFRIEVQDSIEAQQARTLPAAIWIVPQGILEYIEINFIISPTGVSLNDLTA